MVKGISGHGGDDSVVTVDGAACGLGAIAIQHADATQRLVIPGPNPHLSVAAADEDKAAPVVAKRQGGVRNAAATSAGLGQLPVHNIFALKIVDNYVRVRRSRH
jgi:hypothetical protein